MIMKKKNSNFYHKKKTATFPALTVLSPIHWINLPPPLPPSSYSSSFSLRVSEDLGVKKQKQRDGCTEMRGGLATSDAVLVQFCVGGRVIEGVLGRYGGGVREV